VNPTQSAQNPPRKVTLTKVLFVCFGNACRSPIAESIARYDAADVMDVSSAGLVALGFIPQLTKETLTKNGYSSDGLKSKNISTEAWSSADIVINMSGTPRERAFPDYDKVEDWLVDDPYGADARLYQTIFESIRRRVGQLAKDLRHKRESGQR
jgi:protein-tyrosine-phosphatase